jgi:hypothetical protein
VEGDGDVKVDTATALAVPTQASAAAAKKPISGTLATLRLNSGSPTQRVLPFLWKQDALRGAMTAAHLFLGYMLMLAVM